MDLNSFFLLSSTNSIIFETLEITQRRIQCSIWYLFFFSQSLIPNSQSLFLSRELVYIRRMDKYLRNHLRCCWNWWRQTEIEIKTSRSKTQSPSLWGSPPSSCWSNHHNCRYHWKRCFLRYWIRFVLLVFLIAFHLCFGMNFFFQGSIFLKCFVLFRNWKCCDASMCYNRMSWIWNWNSRGSFGNGTKITCRLSSWTH